MGYSMMNRIGTKEAYSIALPPPNVTGQLHVGHALDNTLQDILIRYKQIMQGYNVLWLPGKDHAGIATQVKVERTDCGSRSYDSMVWAVKSSWNASGHGRKNMENRIGQADKTSGLFLRLEPWHVSQSWMMSVPARYVKFSVSLYEKGLIYQGNRITNWCPRCQTALSDIEVDHKDEQGYISGISITRSLMEADISR